MENLEWFVATFVHPKTGETDYSRVRGTSKRDAAKNARARITITGEDGLKFKLTSVHREELNFVLSVGYVTVDGVRMPEGAVKYPDLKLQMVLSKEYIEFLERVNSKEGVNLMINGRIKRSIHREGKSRSWNVNVFASERK